jgi:hypothetical protein
LNKDGTATPEFEKPSISTTKYDLATVKPAERTSEAFETAKTINGYAEEICFEADIVEVAAKRGMNAVEDLGDLAKPR